jgi:tetratricopeptide (TPR) repeat protein
MGKNKIFQTFLFLLIITACIFPAQKALASDDPEQFDPDVYKSGDISYRSPGSGEPGFTFDRKKAARDYLVLGYLPDAVDNYKKLAGGDDWKELGPEYAYALSLSGYNEPAMLYLDDAHTKDPAAGMAYYYAGRAFMFAGYGDLAKNFLAIAGKASEIKKNIGAVSYAEMDQDFKSELGYPGKSGVVVLNVFPGPEKFRTGLSTRDIIISADGRAVAAPGELYILINNKQRGSAMELAIWRDGAKKNITVRVASGDDLAGLPEIKKSTIAPDEKAKALLVRAVTLLSEKKYFTSILIYRQLIEAYPGWEIPYLGYTLALEKTGAFECAKKASDQALLAAANDKDAKEQLKIKSKELGSMTPSDRDKWIKGQTMESFMDKPESFYLGFGGGQLMFGGSTGFELAINGRAGILMNTGVDISMNAGYDTTAGFDIGVNATQRFYIGNEYSLNPGASIDLNTGRGSVSIGLLGGGSYYFDNKKSSIDALLTIGAYIGNNAGPSIGFYLGTTRYL